ncbi:MAG: trypsin-like serine protease [Kofleriaceae bacterium]
MAHPLLRTAATAGVLLLATAAHAAPPPPPVIGGTISDPGEFPGVGALMYDAGGGTRQFGCTGTLIAPDVVLTAAHCLDPNLVGPEVPGFTLAQDANAAGITIVDGRMKVPHPMFDINGGVASGLGQFFDVGLLFLAQPITEVAPVPMPRPEDAAELVAGLELELAGYGLIEVNGQDGGVMYDAKTSLVSLNDTEIQVGMGSPQPQNCNGDSGGPGFAVVGGQRRVVGVVSRSFSGFECTMGGVDTRVDAYTDWIHAQVPTGIPCGSGLSPACPAYEEDSGGCCSTGSTQAPGAVGLGLAVAALIGRRRRRTAR